MVEDLKDLLQREVIPKSKRHVFILGSKVFYLLKKIFLENKVKGCFFSHYPNEVKFNLRFDNKEGFGRVNPIVEEFLNENRPLIDKPGTFYLKK